MILQLALQRQRVYNDGKLVDKFVLDEDVLSMIQDDEVAGTPVEEGEQNMMVAEDGTEYEIEVLK